MIKFSIVTVTYNAENVLERTLDSVLCQSFFNIEHIIIDGKSTDSTMSIAERYREDSQLVTSHEVLIVSEKDNGIYDAMNKGLWLATGDYILFLNAGDTLPHGETLASICRKVDFENMPPAQWPAVVYGDTAITDEDGNRIGQRRLRPPKHLTWKSFRQGMLVCHQAFYVRLDIAAPLSYNLQYRYSADVDWCIRVMKRAAKRKLPLTNVGFTIANYTKEGLSTIHHRDSLKERFRIMADHYGLWTTIAMHAWFMVRNVFK